MHLTLFLAKTRPWAMGARCCPPLKSRLSNGNFVVGNFSVKSLPFSPPASFETGALGTCVELDIKNRGLTPHVCVHFVETSFRILLSEGGPGFVNLWDAETASTIGGHWPAECYMWLRVFMYRRYAIYAFSVHSRLYTNWEQWRVEIRRFRLKNVVSSPKVRHFKRGNLIFFVWYGGHTASTSLPVWKPTYRQEATLWQIHVTWSSEIPFSDLN